MFIKNDIVTLRIAEPHDAELIYRWENDMDVWRDSETRVPFSRMQIEEFLLNNNDLMSMKQLRLMIEDTQNGAQVGCIDIYDYDEFNSRAGFGILIDEKYRGKDYAKNAISLLLKYCFNTLLLNQIYALVLETNVNSIKLFESLGFVRCGVKKQWYKTADGFVDQIEYQYIRK
ncbi:MAG: GNAT family N-acetyltransferase [Bacteroidales bacterium]|jgi:diamine N-acetyltransferase|nr:GNAT family N-acetyltransferase [Bacteroidales bacterium]